MDIRANYQDVLAQIDRTLILNIEDRFPGARCVGGKYSPASHTVTLYKEDIAIQCERLLGDCSRLKEYEWIILAHETGHAMDQELPALSKRLSKEKSVDILAQIELNAWRNAEELFAFIDQELFQLVKEESLRYFSNSPLIRSSSH